MLENKYTVSSRKFVRLLEKSGAHFVRQKGTSHAMLSPKYIKLVLRQLGFSDEEIDGMFKR